ncbi:ABC transporter permease [Pedobacter caeni]|uniref:Putative ABC transport system permease protein n=1 Tax=Pedobacter caeni TaxID=288992 RepID=A0A1M5AMR1_9SPHI|nr:ABC transporter permease [Pedobacter caeni]SHF31212.1 putative ABC transport system permease protein [Pedobacter caeni]
MFRLNLKIALRNLWKNKGYTAINIGGLAIALAAFIMVVIYVSFETTFDHHIPNHSRIYLVGRSLPDGKTNYTPASLAQLMKDACPEIENVGRSKKTGFEFAFSTDAGRIYGKNVLSVDYEMAKMFHLWPDNGLKKPAADGYDLYVPQEFADVLFPRKKPIYPQLVAMGPKDLGQSANIQGIINYRTDHSSLKFDAMVILNDIGANQDPKALNYQTYIEVKEGADIAQLEQKIDGLFKKELIKNGMTTDDRVISGRSVIFLDPLDNLHLRPVSGNSTNYKIVLALGVLGLLVLVIACINFTNLTIAQTNRRAKEVGVKKVLGAFRMNLIFQFLIEILMQCLLALVIGLALAELFLPYFNGLFETSLSLWKGNGALVWQLPAILIVITLISGVYPALVLSGFRPAEVLKGNLQTSYKTLWLRNALLVTQFSVAIVFIAGLLIVSTQLKYMKTEDTGFKPAQVVFIQNTAWFKRVNFEQLRAKVKEIPGVNSFTVASNIPDGSKAAKNTYSFEGREQGLDMITVDFDYFETLNLKIKEGRFFSKSFNTDTVNSMVLNESAVSAYGIVNPIGKTIRGCNMDYRIVGVIKDFKAQGFETAVEPTVYTIKNPCIASTDKYMLMVNADQDKMAAVLATLKANWKDLNKLDGEDFRYEFLDELYGRLFKKQEQLQAVFYCAAVLTIFIAVLGLFAFSAFSTNNRRKEIAVRKILGATDFQVLGLLNSFFIRVVLIANLIGWPIAYIIAKKWLDTFAYRIEVPILPFVFAALISTVLTVFTVSIQARKAVKANPVDALKYE